MLKNIEVEKIGYVMTITLNRPESMNALNEELLLELEQVLAEIVHDENVRAVVITGKGKAFCAGADLKYAKTILSDRQKQREFIDSFQRILNGFEDCPKPIIAAINGVALAGGLEIVEACDIAIAAENAKLGDQHNNFGLIPGGGGSQRLPRLIGVRKAKELLFTGQWLSAEEALKVGLINRIVPAEMLMKSAVELATLIAEKSPLTNAILKNLVNTGMQTNLRAALKLEVATVIDHYASEDLNEGIKAFTQKRKPVFKGR